MLLTVNAPGRQSVHLRQRIHRKLLAVRKDFVEYCIKAAQFLAAGESDISLRAKIPMEPLRQILGELVSESKIFSIVPGLYIHSDTLDSLEGRLLGIVKDFHRDRPESPGIGIEGFYESSGIQKNVFDGVVRLLISQGKLVERKHALALAGHRETFDHGQKELLDSVESLFIDRLFKPPGSEEIVEYTGQSSHKVQEAVRILIEHERLVKVEQNLIFHSRAIEKAEGVLTSFIRKEGRLESVKFKYLLGTTRKFAIPLLDYFDRVGVTRRDGNTRYLKNT